MANARAYTMAKLYALICIHISFDIPSESSLSCSPGFLACICLTGEVDMHCKGEEIKNEITGVLGELEKVGHWPP